MTLAVNVLGLIAKNLCKLCQKRQKQDNNCEMTSSNLIIYKIYENELKKTVCTLNPKLEKKLSKAPEIWHI